MMKLNPFRLFARKKRRVSHYVKSELLTADSPFIITEAYKAMRTNLMFMLSGNNKKVIAFTSGLANEGKTTTCLNLGIAFGQTGHKILIIDMDMRKPRLHRYFDVPSAPGLSDFLGGFSSEIPIAQTAFENVSVLPVGTIPPSPPELLMSKTFDSLLEKIRDEFDYVFIDTPPIHLVTDLAIIANKLDGVVFIVRENSITLEVVKESIKSLEHVNAKVLGFILNDSEGSSPFAQYKYRRRYKGQYGYAYGYSLPTQE